LTAPIHPKLLRNRLHPRFPSRPKLLGHNLVNFRRVTRSLLIDRLCSHLAVRAHYRLLDCGKFYLRPLKRRLHDVEALSIERTLNILPPLALRSRDILAPPLVYIGYLPRTGEGGRKLLTRRNRSGVNYRSVVNAISGWHS
jgi:hypothetical protein